MGYVNRSDSRGVAGVDRREPPDCAALGTTFRKFRSDSQRRHRLGPLCALMAVATLAGCHLPMANWFVPSPAARPCELQPNLMKAELIRHLNNRINRVAAWSSTDVQISGAGFPVKLSASIAVERPLNFRLRASTTITGNEADLGSNSKRFWFWMRRSPIKRVMTSSHERTEQVECMMNIPFQPDWLMEALGVIPIDETQFLLQPDPNHVGIVSLVSQRETPSGEPVRRVILVDTCHGHIVAHELYDRQNRLIARAELNDYKHNNTVGVSLPHRINFDWPQARTALTLQINGPIEVNPSAIPAQTWLLPEIRGYPKLDLDHVQPMPAKPGRARIQSNLVPPPTSRRSVEQTGWDVEPAGQGNHAKQTAEVPPSAGATTTWQPPTNRNNRPNTHTLTAAQNAEVPPWDEGATVEQPPSSHRTPSTGTVRGLRSADSAPANTEEPPWDAEPQQLSEQRSRPKTVIDLIKASFARIRGSE